MTTRRPGADRKREIADAALQVIAREGLGRFTSASLAQQVGLTNGALFRHFTSMDEIVSAAIDRAEEVLFEAFPPRDADPLERMGKFFCQRVRTMLEHPGVMRVVYSNELARAAGEAGEARVRGFKKRSIEFVRGCLQQAAGQGRLAASPEQAEVVVLGAIMVLALLPEYAQAHRDPAQLWEAIERMLTAQPRASEPRA